MHLNRRDFVKVGVAGAAQLSLASRLVSGMGQQGSAAASMRIIDIHLHIISADTARYPVMPVDGQRSDWSKERPTGFEEAIAGMDEAGIWKAAIVQSSTTYGYDNSYVADSVAGNTRRFTGVFAIDIQADDSVEKIRYWAKERKLTGLRLFSHGSTPELQAAMFTDPRTFHGLEVVQAIGLPVCVSLRMTSLPKLLSLVRQFPKIRFVIDHMIEPPIAEGAPYAGSQYLFDMAKFDNIYLKLTTVNVRASRNGKGSPETFFPLLVSKFGASRIAWGSDFPSAKGKLKDHVLEAQSALASLSEHDRESIFSRTALSLYPALAEK